MDFVEGLGPILPPIFLLQADKVILLIILVSMLPTVVEVLRARSRG